MEFDWRPDGTAYFQVSGPFREDMKLTKTDIQFDLELSNSGTMESITLTEEIIFKLLGWYCKKFKKTSNTLDLKDIETLFEQYSIHYMDGASITEIKNSYVYG